MNLDESADHDEENRLNGADALPSLPIYNPEAEFDDEDMEEGPRTVLITGAAGNIGRKLRAAWSELYDLVLIDSAADPDDPDLIVADLAELDEDWITHFHGVDTVIHLAANPNDAASWEDLVGPNLDALGNVLHASALAGVDRVIFASSNHVMGGYRELDDGPIGVARPPRPDGPYGATKLMGERLGRSLASSFDMTFIALRLGWIQPGENRPETLTDDWSRGLWLSNGDLVRLFEGAVESDMDDRDFLVANGMSNNRGMRWDLSEAIEWLEYHPEDDAYAGQPES
ncbi:uronate dehydrogenase [Singulisphaera sp. GP187]|uniref:NAD-dependent epimerase/dehydratase family protein n=1 Tax=Singulisphaera sp. GP187 TaxID=1882752 RepID=UPI000925F19B|nr:NAD(P)-dependent oxidoreductase [Singulisphaera sp. GP187]SIO44605.1 uronate dehydrogenase [Singulisphaera sp. GP187]